MVTAIDTNILIDIFGGDAKFGPHSAEAARRCLRDGALVACAVVWAEGAAIFKDERRFVDAMNEVPASFSPISQNGALIAAEVWQRYRAGGGRRERIIADFLIGGHAATAADRLLTRDRGFYRRYFSDLSIVDPTPS